MVFFTPPFTLVKQESSRLYIGHCISAISNLPAAWSASLAFRFIHCSKPTVATLYFHFWVYMRKHCKHQGLNNGLSPKLGQILIEALNHEITGFTHYNPQGKNKLPTTKGNFKCYEYVQNRGPISK